eukprot:UN20853
MQKFMLFATLAMGIQTGVCHIRKWVGDMGGLTLYLFSAVSCLSIFIENPHRWKAFVLYISHR